MPKIFEENSRLKIIEYGNSESMIDIMREARDSLLKMIKP